MLKLRKLIFPIVFGISLSGYSTYALLDTFIIEEVVSDAIFDDDFFSSSSQSAISISSPSSISSSVSNSVTSNELSNVISSSEVINTSSSEEINIIDEYFTSVPVLEENSYTDQNISIHINEEIVQVKNYSGQMVDTKVYTADIRLKSIEYLRTCLAKDKYGMKIVEKTSSMAERNNAIFAFNGDYYGAQEKGYVLRNGTVFRDVRKASTIEKGDLAIYSDGSFEYFREKPNPLESIKNYKIDEGIKAYQVFSFGPVLVNDSIRVVEEGDEVAVYSKLGNQRCAIGYIDNLHYVVSVCDGRLKDSWGMELYQIADYMISKGCKSAYNLDGGGSATIWFNGKVLNRPNTNGDNDIKEREISDCVYIAPR